MPDQRQAPPPRYRVIERDRKLVVIDTVTGDGMTQPAAPTSTWLPKQIQFDGSAELNTHTFYDDKGPRRIRIDPGSAAAIGRIKLIALFVAFALVVAAIANIWLLAVPVFLLGNTQVRAGARKAVTRWLDRVEREAS